MRIRTSASFLWTAAPFAALLLLAAPASAQQSQGPYKTGYGRQAGNVWATEDKCSTEAQKAFPDHDAASNARREAARHECMVRGNVRYGTAPTPAAPAK